MIKTDISVILPVYGLDDTTKQLFANAVKSVQLQKTTPDELVIVVAKDSEDAAYVKAFDYTEIKTLLNISIIENEGETDFCSQVNLGITKAKSNWISILEADDELSSIWFKNAIKYRSAYDNVGIFMPLIVDVDGNGTFIGLTNEAPFAQSFSDELGILDHNSLLAYQNFNTDGMLIKKELFEEFGYFKSNVKLTFIYEFLLRMTFKDVRVMIVPKFGYKHVNQREGSIFAEYKKTLDPTEAKWWLAQAKKEYYFSNERKINYVATTNA
jgi:GT2 family glycosyltransferase